MQTDSTPAPAPPGPAPSLLPLPLLLAAALAPACTRAPAPPPPGPDQSEVARPANQLLIERVSRSGQRSFVTKGLDGSFVASLPGVPADAVHVVPAPDGWTLAALRSTAGLLGLWLLDRDGMNPRRLVEGSDRTVDWVAWSPDGRRLAFELTTDTDPADIWVMNADGTGAVDLTPDPKPGVFYDRTPAWSPDGARIAFSSNRSGTTRLWTMRADGSDPVLLGPPDATRREHEPAWSPDGSLIAFVAETPEAAGLGVVRPDGSGWRLFPLPQDAGSPAWLPDGRLLFTDRRSGDYEAYAVDLETGVTSNLSQHRDHDVRVGTLRHVPGPAWLGLAPPVRYPVGQAAAPGLAAGDFDADGLTDLAVLSPAVPEVRLLRGVGAGAFATLGGLEAGAGGLALGAAGVSLDPAPDLVVLEPDAFSLYRGGAGGPGLATRHALPGAAHGMVLRDLDASGRADVAAVYDRPGGTLHVEISSIGGDDQPTAIIDLATGFTAPLALCAGDVTGEGADDLVVLTGAADAPVLLLAGRGDITFDAPIVAATGVQADVRTIPLCADLDGDGRSDLVLLQPGQPGGLQLLPWRGTAFGPATRLDLGGDAIAAADLDHDGDVDLLVASRAGKSLSFLRNRGDGRFAAPVTIPLGRGPVAILVADLDGDTWPDVATTDVEGAVLVLRNLARDPAAGG